MFYSLKLEPFETPPDSLLRPDWFSKEATPNLPQLCPLTTRSAPPISQLGVAHPPPLMMPTPEEIADAAAAAARSRRPKGTSAIGIEHFKSGVDDFEEWVELFECAVNLATKAPTAAEKQADYWEWLALRLDKPARAILAQAKVNVNGVAQAENRTATWAELKAALTLLLVDPHEKQKWHMKYMTVKWDGIESLHAFASRVITSVNKFDKAMDLAYRTREFFLRFRMGLPKQPYQDAIDMNMSFEDGTIEFAKIIALRAQLTLANAGEGEKHVNFANASMPTRYGMVTVSDQYVAMAPPGDAIAGAPSNAGAPPPKVYGNASMQDSRTSTLETSLAGIDTKLENINVNLRQYDSRIGTLEKDFESMKRSGNPGPPNPVYPNFWPPPNQGQWGYPNYWPPQGYAGGYSVPFRPASPHRSQSPHRSGQTYRPQSPNRSFQPNRPTSPRHSTQQYQQQQPQYPNQQYQQQQLQYPNQQHQQQQPQYPTQQFRGQSPNRSGPQGRPQSPRSSQRGPSPNRSGQKYFPSPGKAHPSTTHPKYQQQGTSNDQYRAVDTGDEASGYESEKDQNAEVAHEMAELEKKMAKLRAKAKGN